MTAVETAAARPAKDYSKRCDYEAASLQMIDDYMAKNWTPTGAVVAMVWRSMWSSALPVESIARIGAAMAHYREGADITADVQTVLTAMARAKVLRSRRDQGRKFYEMNF